MNMFRAFMELDKLTEHFDTPQPDLEDYVEVDRPKSEYYCSSCGLSGVFYDDDVVDLCCPRCKDHHGGFAKCDDDMIDILDNEELAYLRNKPKYAWTEEDWELYAHYIKTASHPQDWRGQLQETCEVSEGVFDDLIVSGRDNWVSRTPVQQATPSTSVQPSGQTMTANTNSTGNTNIVTIVYDVKAHKLRAKATDGVHGYANVAFPNNLRTRDGQQYRVGGLIWNGKNYRVTGSIVAI